MEKKYFVIGSIVVIIMIILITIGSAITTIPTGYVGVKTRFGKVQDTTIQEGLNMKAPFIESIVKIDCRTKKIESTSESSTKDLQTVQATIAVNYNVNKDTANTLYKEVGTDYENIIINPAILESIKSTMAQYTAEELITKRSEVSAMIQEALINKIDNRGFNVTEFNITNIDFSDAYNAAIETKAVKQQEVVTAQAELEKAKIENEKRIENAKADAEVMRQQNQEITEKTLQLKQLEIQQEMIKKWNGQLPTYNMGNSVPFLNLNK